MSHRSEVRTNIRSLAILEEVAKNSNGEYEFTMISNDGEVVAHLTKKGVAAEGNLGKVDVVRRESEYTLAADFNWGSQSSNVIDIRDYFVQNYSKEVAIEKAEELGFSVSDINYNIDTGQIEILAQKYA